MVAEAGHRVGERQRGPLPLVEEGRLPPGGDFRAPQGLRIGLSPLSTSFAELYRGVAAIRELLSAREAETATAAGSWRAAVGGRAGGFDKIADVPLN